MWTFNAMNTVVTLAAPDLAEADERQLAHEVARLFADTERRFSRFRDDSELAALNRATRPIVVSPELVELLCAARAHAEETHGLFDPTVGSALCRAGYDRSFASGLLDRDAPTTPATPVHFADLELDEHTCRVSRPPHVQLDFGGFLKGRTVDRAARLAPAAVMIDAGGDALLRGTAEGWLVDVEDPFDARNTVVTLRVRDRAIATSASNRRRWRLGDQIAHHLIDPRTGEASRSDLAQVTVLASSAERADVLAKTIFLLGATTGTRMVEHHADLGAVLVTRSGVLHVIGAVEVADA